MKNWYIWWIERAAGGGQWFGPYALDDEELWRFEYDVRRGTVGVRGMYRWLWDGATWQYDTRNATSLYVRAGQQKFAAFD